MSLFFFTTIFITDNRLLLEEKNKILITNLQGNDRQIIKNYDDNVLIGLDYVNGEIFYCDSQTRRVYSYNLNEKKEKIVIKEQKNWLPISLAIDSTSHDRRIYVAEGISDTVQIFVNGSLEQIVVGNHASKLKKIVLDPYEGYLFVLDEYQV